MDKPSAPFQFIYNYVEKEDFQKYLRLTMIVCFYIFARTYYSNWAKRKHIARQIELDKQEKSAEKERKEQEQTQKIEKLDSEAKTFGWGKATRRKVKIQEQIVLDTAEQLREREQGAYDAAEDHDIEDLLEE